MQMRLFKLSLEFHLLHRPAAFLRAAVIFFGLFGLTTLPALAQVTNTNAFDISIRPTNGTLMVSLSTNPVFVTINNFTNFTNITVVGSFDTSTNLQFLDTGVAPDRAAADGIFANNLIIPFTRVGGNTPLTLVITGEDLFPPDPTITNIVVVTNVVIYGIVPRPDNDNFTNAFKVEAPGGIISATNDFASLEAREPIHGQISGSSASVWWKWSPATSTNVLVDLGGSSFDPILAVYTGDALSNLVLVAASTNDTLHKQKANVEFNARGGATYRIAIAGYDTNGLGDIRLRIAPGAHTDLNQPVSSITSPPSESLFTTNAVLFRGTAKERFDNDSGIAKVLLRINTQTNFITANGTENWTALLDLPPGTNLIQAYAVDYAGNQGRPSAVVVRYVDPINDDFENALPLFDIAGQVETVNGRATRQAGEPFHAGNEGGRSIWYSFRPPSSGQLQLSTEGSSFDTLLGLYIGSGVSNLVTLAQNDDAFPGSGWSTLVSTVVGGQLYYVAIDGFGADSGNVLLGYAFISVDPNLFSVSVASPLGGAVSPPSDLYPEGATVLLTALPDRNFEFVEWQDGAGAFYASENPLRLVINQNYSLQCRFRVKTYTETFKSGHLGGLPWSTVGPPWSVQSVNGQFAARSGPVGDSQTSSLVLVTNMFQGAGVFDFSVDSELGFDALEFFLNGLRLGRWSGNVPWQTFQFAIPAGLNTLEWRYTKDANFSRSLDAAFIDNLYLPLERPLAPGTNAVLSVDQLLSGDFQLTLRGQPNVTYIFQGSANLTTWLPLHTNTSSGVTIQFIDLGSSRLRNRYYRVMAP
jgi:hypothetical protein